VFKMPLQLSESLYPVDEVIATFIQCILAKHSLDECLFWLWELIYTTPNICDGLMVIYQQFYSHTNQNVATYVVRKLQSYCDTGVKRHLADIVNNLLTMSSSPDAYYIVKASQSDVGPTVIYKRSSLAQVYPPILSCLLCAIKTRDIKNIGAYAALCLTTIGFADTKCAIIHYANTIGNAHVDTGLLCHGEIITLSYLISRIINRTDMTRTKFVRANAEAVLKMENHFTRKSARADNLLSERRLYPTHSFVPPSSYSRFTTDCVSFEDACRHHWTYYCFNSVEWYKRFNASGCYLDHDKRQVIWSTDEELEAFYSSGYYIDFDEHPQHITCMSTHQIEVIDDPCVWYESIILLRLANLSL
jgi:hypothetical protein